VCPLFLCFSKKTRNLWDRYRPPYLKHVSFICTVTGIATKQCYSTQNLYAVEHVPVPVLTCADRSVGCIFSKNKTAAYDVTVIERKMFVLKTLNVAKCTVCLLLFSCHLFLRLHMLFRSVKKHKSFVYVTATYCLIFIVFNPHM
jgi:hypothetical protein